MRSGAGIETLTQRAEGVRGSGDDLPRDPQPLLVGLNDEINRRLDRQFDTVTQLDVKAGALLTFEVTATGLLLAHHAGNAIYAAIAAFALAAALTLTCLGVRGWSNAPRPDLLAELEIVDPATAYDRLVRSKVMAELRNESGLVAKAEWLKIATWWLLVPAAITIIALS